MDRRTFAIGLAIVPSIISRTAFAQPSPLTTTSLPDSDLEAKYHLDTMTIGIGSLELSKVAQRSASSAKVKQFANFEVAEQETIGEVIKTMMSEDASGKTKNPAPQGVARSGNAANPVPAPDTQSMNNMKTLQALQGEQFDREYLKMQIAGHEKLLSIQEDYLTKGKDTQNRTLAMLARGMIKEHLALLDDLKVG